MSEKDEPVVEENSSSIIPVLTIVVGILSIIISVINIASHIR